MKPSIITFLLSIQLLFVASVTLLQAQTTCTVSGSQNFPATCDEVGVTIGAATDIVVAAGATLDFNNNGDDWTGNTITVLGTLVTSHGGAEIVASGGISVNGGTFTLGSGASIGSNTQDTPITVTNGTLNITGNSTMYGNVLINNGSTSTIDAGITLNGNLKVGPSSSLTLSKNMDINGELIAEGGGTAATKAAITIASGATISVESNVYAGTSTANSDDILTLDGQLKLDGCAGELLYIYGTVVTPDASSSDKVSICGSFVFVGGTSGTSCTSIVGKTMEEIIAEGLTPPYCLDASFSGPLIFTPTGPLPVELMAFEGEFNGDNIELHWMTATESNNDRFEVETSKNGTVFHKIGELDGAGTTDLANSYVFQDYEYQQGLNYYRLKQVDYDGTYAYSWVVVVSIGEGVISDLLVYPNPSNKSYFNIKSGNAPLERVLLYDLTGREVLSWRAYELANQHQLDIQGLSKGNYIMNIFSGGKRIQKKVIIN